MSFWFKNPKDMTEEEKWALPIGPIVVCERDYTFAEMVAGVAKGAKVCWSIRLETKVAPMSMDETLFDLVGENDAKFKLRQFKNGAWFREPVYL